MDKICRGSRIGESVTEGSWFDNVPDTSGNARGAHITHTSMKLENPEKRASAPKTKKDKVADTFRSQDWFRHDPRIGESPNANEVRHFSPRFWKEQAGLSPAPSPRAATLIARSRSQRSLKGDEPKSPDATQKREVVRVRSEIALPGCDRRGDTTPPRIGDGAKSPRVLTAADDPRGTSSPRDWLFSSGDRGRGRGTSPRANSPGGASDGAREHSPTFKSSERWMGYSSPRAPDESPDSPRPEEGRIHKGFGKPRRFESRLTENSENNPLKQSADSAPTRICNAENHMPSRGKKVGCAVGIAKDEGTLKKRLMMDPSQKDLERTQRRHDFGGHPQVEKHLEHMRILTPRLSQTVHTASSPDFAGGGSIGSRTSPQVQVRALQHRTSPEMVASIAPSEHEVDSREGPPFVPKYYVGNRLLRANSGRRSTQEGVAAVVQTHEHIKQAHLSPRTPPPSAPRLPMAGAAPLAPASTASLSAPPLQLRDHRNSDVVRDHIHHVHMYNAAPAAYAQSTSPRGHWVPQQTVSRSAGHEQNTLPQTTQPNLVAFGAQSMLPTTIPKDSAYLHSGLKVVKYSTRTPGAFSPHMPRVQASQVLAGC